MDTHEIIGSNTHKHLRRNDSPDLDGLSDQTLVNLPIRPVPPSVITVVGNHRPRLGSIWSGTQGPLVRVRVSR